MNTNRLDTNKIQHTIQLDAHYSISMKRQLKYALGFSNSILDAWVKMYKPSMSCMKNNIHFLMYKQRPVKETNILPCLYL